MTVEEAAANIGARVIYRTPGRPNAPAEYGTIVRANNRYIFVRYDEGDRINAQATEPTQLELAG